MNDPQPFPLNAWYVAAWDAEVGRTLLSRTICEKPIVLYRTRQGAAVALADACWHRLVPLSIGKLVGDDVACGYHGIVYGADGRCTHMPSQETVNPSASVRSYPVIERHRFVWVWPGEPALADPSTIPDLGWADDPDWAGDGRMNPIKADYRLVVDNLMDLTHETFVHASSLGNAALAEVPFNAFHGDRTAMIERWVMDAEPPPFWAAQLAKPGKVDRWQIINFIAPATILLEVGVAPAGTGARDGDRSHDVDMRVIHCPTPSTRTTCYYFWSHLRNYRTHDQGLTRRTLQAGGGILAEDEYVIEAQQKAVDANPGHVFYNLNIDAGSLWARRAIDRMIALETGKPQPVAAE